MAIRIIVKEPDPILREIAKPVPKVTSNIVKLLEDMAETMYDAGGVGISCTAGRYTETCYSGRSA